MFKINPSPTFECQVLLSVPGAPAPVNVTFTFRHKTSEQITAWLNSMASGNGDSQSLSEVIESWKEVKDDRGDEVLYSIGALGDLLSGYPAASGEILRAYLKELTESKVKN